MKNTLIKTGIVSMLLIYCGTLSAQITGSGSAGKIPKFTSATAIGNSQIYDNGTNIGFGTTNIVQKFHFVGNGLFTLAMGGVSNSAPLIQASNGWTSAASPDFTWYLNTNTGLFHPASNVIGFSSGGIEAMRIHSDGSVGIGTTTLNTAFKMSVKGAIRCEKVVVEIGWADYVFHKDYKLMPLNELEKYISSNRHLPNIPAASEIEKNGLDIGAVQAKQMEKIEELTLYIIEMNKKIKEQNERVAQLEKGLGKE